jgi:hypothetical protein
MTGDGDIGVHLLEVNVMADVIHEALRMLAEAVVTGIGIQDEFLLHGMGREAGAGGGEECFAATGDFLQARAAAGTEECERTGVFVHFYATNGGFEELRNRHPRRVRVGAAAGTDVAAKPLKCDGMIPSGA